MMKSVDFVSQIRKIVINENINVYRDLFLNTDPDSVTDEYWIKALKFFNSIDESSRGIFFEIIRQIEIDTTSNILGILDGVSWLEDQDEEFLLTMENSKEPINGDLQDIFLAQEEDN